MTSADQPTPDRLNAEPAAVQPGTEAPAPIETQRLPVRRRPSLKAFLGLPGAIGLVLGMIVGFTGPDAAQSTRGQETVMVGTVGLLLGLLLGAVAYLLADRATRRR